jgi:hypothetical protein
VINRFQTFAFKWVNLYRYSQEPIRHDFELTSDEQEMFDDI